MPSYGKIARAGTFWAYLRQGIAIGLAVPTAMMLARLLSPEDFGIAAAAGFFAQLSGRLTKAGLNLAIIRVKQLEPIHISSVFVFNVLSSVAILIMMVVAAPALGQFFDSPSLAGVLPVASFNFVLNAFGAVPMALLRRDMQFKRVMTSQTVGMVTEAVTAVCLAFLGFAFWSVICAVLASNVTSNAVAIWSARWKPSFRVSLAALRELFSFGAGAYTNRLLDYAAQNIDNLIVARLLGVAALGSYDRAFSTMNRVLNQLNGAGPGVSFRIFAVIQEDAERFRRAYRKVVLSVTFIAYPLFAFMGAAGFELIPVFFGPQWLAAVRPFQILCVAGMFRALNDYTGSANQALGWVWSEVWRQALYVTMIVGGIVALQAYGITGAAVAVLIASAVMFTLKQSLLQRIAGFSWRDLFEPQMPGLLCAVGIAVLTFLVRAIALVTRPSAGALELLVLQAMASGLLYTAFVFFSGFEDVRQLLRETIGDYAPQLAAKIPSRTTSSRPRQSTAAS